jgi:hypothetical protein
MDIKFWLSLVLGLSMVAIGLFVVISSMIDLARSQGHPIHSLLSVFWILLGACAVAFGWFFVRYGLAAGQTYMHWRMPMIGF